VFTIWAGYLQANENQSNSLHCLFVELSLGALGGAEMAIACNPRSIRISY
jgi:hypothetical protein